MKLELPQTVDSHTIWRNSISSQLPAQQVLTEPQPIGVNQIQQTPSAITRELDEVDVELIINETPLVWQTSIVDNQDVCEQPPTAPPP